MAATPRCNEVVGSSPAEDMRIGVLGLTGDQSRIPTLGNSSLKSYKIFKLMLWG